MRRRNRRSGIRTCALPPGQNGLVTTVGPAMSEMLPLRDTDPREVGGYRLLGRLGEGGQGVVYLALSASDTPAAVKLLAPTTDPQVRNRFLKEVAAAQQVAGFCTAQVLDAGIFERRPFIVSEYVSGPSLVEVIQQHGARRGKVLERIAVATLTALGAVHAVGMVHRDFKPGNVLLGPDGPVVIDFGLAAVPGMTTTGLSGQVAVGTPAFMAPEQLAGARLTAAADMWSWAVTIAFTGTGELPFKGESLTPPRTPSFMPSPRSARFPNHWAPSSIAVSARTRPSGRPPAARSPNWRPPERSSPALSRQRPPRSPRTHSHTAHHPGLSRCRSHGRAATMAGPAPGRCPSRSRTRTPSGRIRWRWRLAAAAIAILLLAGSGGTALFLAQPARR